MTEAENSRSLQCPEPDIERGSLDRPTGRGCTRTRLTPTGYHPRSLQNPSHPAAAEPNLMLGAQLLVNVPHIQIEITLPVRLQHPLHGRYRRALGQRLSSPTVEQPAEPELLIPLPPAPHLPVAEAQDLGRLPPADLLGHRLQDRRLASYS